jgi:endoglucanase
LTRKPVIIGEMASSEVGGNKAAWITSAYLRELPARFPRLVAVVWFDEDKETDWRVNSSASALAAYRRVAASPLYQPPRQGLLGVWSR